MVAQAKLTLRLSAQLIQRAKQHSNKTGKSVSQMVANYFTLLDEAQVIKRANLSPTTLSLKGVLKGNKLNKKNYYRYLENKYL